MFVRRLTPLVIALSHAVLGLPALAEPHGPLVPTSDYRRTSDALHALSTRCAELHFQRLKSPEALRELWRKEALPTADGPGGADAFDKRLGIFSPEKVRGLVATSAAADRVHRAVFHFGVELAPAALQNKVAPLSSGTGFFVSDQGHAMTALHTLHAALAAHPTLTPAQREIIEARGVNPKDFPDGIELTLADFRGGAPKGRNVELSELSSKKVRVLLTAPVPLDRANFVKQNTRGGMGDKDWVLLQLKREGPFLPLDTEVLTDANADEKQLFLAGFSAGLSRYPLLTTEGGALPKAPRLSYCWREPELADLARVEKRDLFNPASLHSLKDKKLSLVVGAAGPGDSGGPIFCNDGQRVCALASTTLQLSQQFETPTAPLPPMPLRVTPFEGFWKTLREHPRLLEALQKK